MQIVFLLGIIQFKVNVLFMCQAVKNLSAHLTYLRFGLFCNFLVISFVYK